MSYIPLLVADRRNRLRELPEFAACGMAGSRTYVLQRDDLVLLPRRSPLFVLPLRRPSGFSLSRSRYQQIEGFLPVAALLPPGYTQVLTAAYGEEKQAPVLPLFTYAAVAQRRGRLYAAAMRVDRRRVHDITAADRARLPRAIRAWGRTRNRLIRHLAACACVYCCPNAINFFLGRYECPLPVSPQCNAQCRCCISRQPRHGPPASQARLTFIPTAQEVADVALVHCGRVRHPIVSFGQGCEGEPLLQAPLLVEAVTRIRRDCRNVTIHLNTNAGNPDAVAALCRAGLSSIRVSISSTRPEYYRRYCRPRGYGWNDVIASIRTAKRAGAFVSINYLVMPGFTDDEREYRSLRGFLRRTRIDMIQWRNLNCDPQWFFRTMRLPAASHLIGVRRLREHVRHAFPRIRHGYFNVFLNRAFRQPKGAS